MYHVTEIALALYRICLLFIAVMAASQKPLTPSAEVVTAVSFFVGLLAAVVAYREKGEQ